MAKKNSKYKNIFQIIGNGAKVYLQKFFHMSECMVFPVVGQLVGIFWILGVTILFSQNIQQVEYFIPALRQSLTLVFLFLGILVVPGFFLFTRAFWDYMIVCVSLNLMVEDAVKNKKLSDCNVYNKIIRLRAKDYIILLGIIALIWLLGIFLPFVLLFFNIPVLLKQILFIAFSAMFMLILTILTVYLSLSFQVFAFENYRKPVEVLKRSLKLVTGNFWRTTLLAIVLFILTSIVIPSPFIVTIENSFLLKYVSYPFELFANHMFSLPGLNEIFWAIPGLAKSPNPIMDISNYMAVSTISLLITAFILPFGTACYALLYKDIVYRREKNFKKK